jgi:hypothetical protein
MLVGIGDLHLDIKREGIYTGIIKTVLMIPVYIPSLLISKCRSPMPTNMWKTLTV